MYVVYDSNDEVIICTLLDEDKVILDYFTNSDREIENYCRSVQTQAVSVTARLVAES